MSELGEVWQFLSLPVLLSATSRDAPAELVDMIYREFKRQISSVHLYAALCVGYSTGSEMEGKKHMHLRRKQMLHNQQ